MKRLFYISILILASAKIYAQQSDTLKHMSLQDTLHLPTGKIDSLSSKAKHRINSISKKLQRLQGFKFQAKGSKNKKDTLAESSAGQTKTAATEKTDKHKPDSINSKNVFDQYNRKVRLLQKRLVLTATRDTTNHRPSQDTLDLPEGKKDSLSKTKHKTGRISKGFQRLQGFKIHTKDSKNKKDTLTEASSASQTKTAATEKTDKHKPDSINFKNVVDQYNRKVRLLQKRLVLTATRDTTNHRPSQDTLDLPEGKKDSLSKTKHKTGRISKGFQRLQGFKIHTKDSKNKKDTLKDTSVSNQNKPATEKKHEHKSDSANSRGIVDQYNRKVQLLQKHFKYHLDSLDKLPTKDTSVTKSMDSLRKKMKQLKNAKSVKDVEKGEQQLAKFQSGLNKKVKGLEGKASKELGELNKLTGANLKVPSSNVPNLNVPNVSLPNMGTNLPNANLGSNAGLPNVSVPEVGDANIPANNVSVPGSGQPGLPNVNSNNANLSSIVLPSGEIKNLGKEAGQLTNATGEITKAEGEIKNLNTDNLEKEAQSIKEVKGLNTDAMRVEQYRKMAEKWNADPEYRKEMAVTKAKEQVINHFAGQEKQLSAAMQQLTNVKAKYKGYEGALDMFKKPGNAMKGKPFIERFRPGFNLQFQSRREFMLDFNPQVGYRLTGGISLGIGWNERWGYDFNKWNYVSNDHIFGPRAYGQVKVKTGVYALIAPEVMNALVPPSFNSPDPGTRKWVWSWMAGIKKEFRYSKSMLGSLQVMYNVLDKHNQSPYTSKLNIRMGFEFQFKKKK